MEDDAVPWCRSSGRLSFDIFCTRPPQATTSNVNCTYVVEHRSSLKATRNSTTAILVVIHWPKSAAKFDTFPRNGLCLNRAYSANVHLFVLYCNILLYCLGRWWQQYWHIASRGPYDRRLSVCLFVDRTTQYYGRIFTNVGEWMEHGVKFLQCWVYSWGFNLRLGLVHLLLANN